MVMSAIARWPQSYRSSVFLGLNILDYYLNFRKENNDGARHSLNISQLARVVPDVDFLRERISQIHRQFDIGYFPTKLQTHNIILHTVNYTLAEFQSSIRNNTDPESAGYIPYRVHSEPSPKDLNLKARFVEVNVPLADTIHGYLLSSPDAVERASTYFNASLDLQLIMEGGLDGHPEADIEREAY